MHPLILVGLDLVVSAVLILMAMFVLWNRVQSHLNSFAKKESDSTAKAPAQEKRQEKAPAEEEAPAEWAFGGITEQAATLKQGGCSMEQIAQRLQLPTREVEMMLAISEMSRTGGAGRRGAAAFALKPDAVRTA